MRFMIIREADKNTAAGKLPTEAVLRAMGLRPSSFGTRIRLEKGKVKTVFDGPFERSNELVAGLTIINVKSKAEALEWVKKMPREEGDGELELRPLEIAARG